MVCLIERSDVLVGIRHDDLSVGVVLVKSLCV